MNHREKEFKTLAIAFTVALIIVAICVIQLFDRLRDYESWRSEVEYRIFWLEQKIKGLEYRIERVENQTWGLTGWGH